MLGLLALGGLYLVLFRHRLPVGWELLEVAGTTMTAVYGTRWTVGHERNGRGTS